MGLRALTVNSRLAAFLFLAVGAMWGQSVTVSVSPTNLNITYLQGAGLPAAQTLSVSASGPGATFTTSITPTGSTPTALWLTAAPESGSLPAKVALHVNPTGLAVGTYTAAVVFTPAAANP